MPAASCILYQNSCATVTLIDVPRSIEEAQGESSLKLKSTKPLEYPFPSLDPKSAKGKENLGQTSLDDLLIQKHLEFALDEVKAAYEGAWCLPRVVESGENRTKDGVRLLKREGEDNLQPSTGQRPAELQNRPIVPLQDEDTWNGTYTFHHNGRAENVITRVSLASTISIPPKSTALEGDIGTSRDRFILEAPDFDIIILDPPWPNRSARRKKSYDISYGSPEIEELLRSVPIELKLAADGLVGVWVTNKAKFREMLLRDGGLFDRWGLTLIEEWVWVKVTKSGEPICALDSAWRKPYEVLLVGKKRSGLLENEPQCKRRVLIGVPDLHSRKPNLKQTFESIIGKAKGEYEGLEGFARNLTAGWWSWGNEALKFQAEEHWAEAVEH
jgi:N6-adenosine-specific RNA methylase IME4